MAPKLRRDRKRALVDYASCCSWISPVVVSSTATCCGRVCRSHPTNVMASASSRSTLLDVPRVSTALQRTRGVGPINDREVVEMLLEDGEAKLEAEFVGG